MCRLRNIAMHDYQESVTTGHTDAGQSDPSVPLCFAGDTIGMHVSPAKHSYARLPRKCDYQTDGQTDRQMDRQTPVKVIPMYRYASQATQT